MGSKDKKIEIIMAVCLLLGAFVLFACATDSEKNSLNHSTNENSVETQLSANKNQQDTNEKKIEQNTTEEAQNQIEEGLEKFIIGLDAGHGASDSGKVGVNGAYEKDINLSIVLFLKEELESRGARVILTRESDEPLYTSSDSNKRMADMKKRIEIVTEEKTDILVSIHQNSYPDAAIKGPQVFYYTASSEGEKLALAIQESFSIAVGEENNKRLAKANSEYYLLLHTPCACVIAECGFLSNYEEADLLVTEEYQKNMAKAVAQGIIDYLLGNN